MSATKKAGWISSLSLCNKLPPNVAPYGNTPLLSSHLCGLGTWAQLSWALQLRPCHKTSRVTARTVDVSRSDRTKTLSQAPPCGGALPRGPLQVPHGTAVGFIREKRASLPGLSTHTAVCASLLSDVGAIRNPTLQMGNEPKIMQLASGRASTCCPTCHTTPLLFLSSNERRWCLSCFCCSRRGEI